MIDADREISALTRALNLAEESQDWGIINSDPGRVGEFIDFLNSSGPSKTQQYALGELIFASMNDAMAEGTADSELLDRFEGFLAEDFHGKEDQVRYWSTLDDEGEFPIALLLRRLMAPA